MMSNKKKKIEIIQDDREPNLQILSDTMELDLKFMRQRLKVGDYKFKDIIIERKTIDDFASSILDNRITTQVEKMKETKKECYVIIIGNIKDRKVEIHENCILGKTVSLVLKHKMKVLICDDDFQFCYLLKNIYEKMEIKNEIQTSKSK